MENGGWVTNGYNGQAGTGGGPWLREGLFLLWRKDVKDGNRTLKDSSYVSLWKPGLGATCDSKSSVYEGDCGRAEDKHGCLRSYSSSPGAWTTFCGWEPWRLEPCKGEYRQTRWHRIRVSRVGVLSGATEARHVGVQAINLLSPSL